MTAAPCRAQNCWIDAEGSFIAAAWYWPTEVAAVSTAVVLFPGIVHEEQPTTASLIALAEALADRGLPALVVNLHGCAHSAGSLDDADIAGRWRADVRSAVRHARSTGAARVIVVGTRLGVPIAVEALADEPLAALVAWAPIVSGKRYLRELKVMQRTDVETAAPGTIAICGFTIPAEVVDLIARLDLAAIDALDASCVVLRDMTERLGAPWLARLGERGVTVQEQVSTEIEPWLSGAADLPELPYEDIEGLARWCRALHDERAADSDPVPNRPAARPSIEFVHQRRLIRETFVAIAPNGLTGVLSEAVDAASGHAARLIMSTVGPGRVFTDFARDEAGRGNTSLRFDFAGFGTSGRGTSIQGGEHYTDQGARDVEAAIDHLRQAGHRHIYALGFCAGAWSMMQAEVAPELRAAVAINVALHYQPGNDATPLSRRTRQRLARAWPVLGRNPLPRGVTAWMRQRRSKRYETIEWLVRLCRSDVRLLLAFAQHEWGLDYLNLQMAKGVRKQLRRPFELITYAGLGHMIEGQSARARLFADVADFFAGLDREAKSFANRRRTTRRTSPRGTADRRHAPADHYLD